MVEALGPNALELVFKQYLLDVQLTSGQARWPWPLWFITPGPNKIVVEKTNENKWVMARDPWSPGVRLRTEFIDHRVAELRRQGYE
jgi:hypothetical protein